MQEFCAPVTPWSLKSADSDFQSCLCTELSANASGDETADCNSARFTFGTDVHDEENVLAARRAKGDETDAAARRSRMGDLIKNR